MAVSSVPNFRAAAPIATQLDNLGPLAELPGTWKGHGFNLISRPNFEGGNPLFLELNATDEQLEFTAIGGPVPNRGSLMKDFEIFGVRYLQQISDHDHASAIHIEPGMWLRVPPTTDPQLPETIVRLGTIPHGNAINVQGSSFTVAGPPRFAVADTTPFEIGDPATLAKFPEFDLSTPSDFRSSPIPSNATQDVVNDPNTLLQHDIDGQTITQTIVLDVSTQTKTDHPLFAGGSKDIPFVDSNVHVAGVSAIFWIETVQNDRYPYDGHEFLQLQYTQTVLLNFGRLTWPHVSVATLRKVT